MNHEYYYMSDNQQLVIDFLNKCTIKFDNFNQLDGMSIPRDTLLNRTIYDQVKDDIKTMKVLYSSGSLTSLQKNAGTNQKWPLLNLVRQILRSNNYIMIPQRTANGYTKEGKKKYLRYFVIKKYKAKQLEKNNEKDTITEQQQ